MINYTMTERLQTALQSHNITPDKYRPAYGESAGLDLFCASETAIDIPPSHWTLEDFARTSYDHTEWNAWKTLIPTGLKIALPKDRVGLICQRGSIIKTPLIHRAGVVDSGFTAEIFIAVLNLSNEIYTLQPNQKLPFQLVVTSVDTQYCYVDEDAYQQLTRHSLRQTAALGSSDTSH